MFNLNLSFVQEVEESGTSNSSVVNAEACSSSIVADDDSVSISVAGDGDGDNFNCYNFDILNVGNTDDPTSQYQAQTPSEFVTRTLFPMNEDGTLTPGHQENSLLLFPNNNESHETKLVNVQPHKPSVQQNQVARKSRRGPRSRSSQYRGVTFYRRTGRWESHIWDCGKQVYLGGFDTAHAAARAYDRAAIKFRGVDADINFNVSDYEEDMNQIKNLSKEDFVHLLRRHSSGFSRGGSKYRGVTLNNCGLWEAPMGQFLGKKANDKAAMKSNAYEGETVASRCGNRNNLDLKLQMSTPSCIGNGSMRNDTMGHMQLNHGFHDMRRSFQAGNASTTTLRGLPVISEHGQSWTAAYPIIVGGSSQGPSNWAWQSYGQGQGQGQSQSQSQSPIALFSAASSGFPAPATTPNSLNYH